MVLVIEMVVAVALATMEVLDPPVLVHWQQINLVDLQANLRQIPILVVGALSFAGLSIAAYERAAALYEKVDL